MAEVIRRALEYALALNDGNPKKIKKNMEEYLAVAGCDRRYKFKWRACSANLKHYFSGIFEYAGKRYYFNQAQGKVELERI